MRFPGRSGKNQITGTAKTNSKEDETAAFQDPETADFPDACRGQTEADGRSADDYVESLDATTLYLNEIGYIPLLNAEQEVQLAREIASGSRNSKNRMIESNLRLVVAIAKRFQNRGLCLLDLVEEGNLGLIRAVEKFNPELGYRFSTYATWWIKQSIDRALMNHAQTIRFPIHVMKDIQACVKAGEQLRELNGREPSQQEVANKTGKSLKRSQTTDVIAFQNCFS